MGWGEQKEIGELAGTALSQSWTPWDPVLLLALKMHFEGGGDGGRATSEGLGPCRPMSTGGAVALGSGCVGEGGVHARPLSSTVFLAFRVTLQCHSAKSVCCSLSSAPWVCPELVPGSLSPESSLPKHTSIGCSVIDFVPLPRSSSHP